MSEIALSTRQSEAWHYLEDDVTTEVGYGGAAGGGKSFFLCLWHIYRRMKYPNTRGLIGRAKLTVLRDSTMVTFFRVCKLMGYTKGIHFEFNAKDNKITWSNGSETLFRDLFFYPSDPDFTRLGSTEYTDVCIDEGTEITQKCFEILNSRIRWQLHTYGLIPKILLTCNPQHGWVKFRFIANENGEQVTLKPYQTFIHALVTDNPDKEFVAIYKQQLERLTSDYDKRRLLYGDWDAVREVQDQFAHQFDHSRHVGERAMFRKDQRLYVSVDFNLSPFGLIFFHMWRDHEGEHFHIVDEMAIPNANIHKMADAVSLKYAPYLPTIGLTGDAMGRQKLLSQRDNASYYIILKRAWKLATSQIKIKNNPTHSNSRADVNYFLLHHPDFCINPKCVNTIRDFQYVECDAYGKILKADRKNENQRADHLDCARYAINTYGKDWIKQHQKTHGYGLMKTPTGNDLSVD